MTYFGRFSLKDSPSSRKAPSSLKSCPTQKHSGFVLPQGCQKSNVIYPLPKLFGWHLSYFQIVYVLHVQIFAEDIERHVLHQQQRPAACWDPFKEMWRARRKCCDSTSNRKWIWTVADIECQNSAARALSCCFPHSEAAGTQNATGDGKERGEMDCVVLKTRVCASKCDSHLKQRSTEIKDYFIPKTPAATMSNLGLL